MTLLDLVTEFASTRAPGWLVLHGHELLLCGIEAARFYAGYGDIKSLSQSDALPGAPGDAGVVVYPDPEPTIVDSLPVKDLGLITEDTRVSVGEWSIIRPLFLLYAERENSQRLETSRALGLEMFGRSVSEIASDIANMENTTLPEKAFSCVAFEV